ncbi:MAG: porin family protein [Flavobacteriales bacterium]
MKKTYLLLLSLVSFSLYGQTQLIGLKSGTSFTNINYENYPDDNNTRNGFLAGLTYGFQFENKFQLELELCYLQKGFRSEIIFTNETGIPTGEQYIYDFNYDYLSIPIKGGYRIGNKFSGFINLGLVPSFLLNATYEIPAIRNLPEEKGNNTDVVNKFDLGGLIELGTSYKLGDQFLIFTTVGYQQSVTSITNDSYYKDSKIKHFGVSIAAGIMFSLPQKIKPKK